LCLLLKLNKNAKRKWHKSRKLQSEKRTSFSVYKVSGSFIIYYLLQEAAKQLLRVALVVQGRMDNNIYKFTQVINLKIEINPFDKKAHFHTALSVNK